MRLHLLPNAVEDLWSRGFAAKFEHEPELAAPANNMYLVFSVLLT